MTNATPRRVALPRAVRKIYHAVEVLSAMYPGRPFTPDDHLVGSIGEVVVAGAFGLKLNPPSQPGDNAHDDNRDVQRRQCNINLHDLRPLARPDDCFGRGGGNRL